MPSTAPPAAPPPAPRPRYTATQYVLAFAGTFVGVTVPIAGLVAAMVLLWRDGFWWVDLALLVGMYLLTLGGTTVGFHRLFTHRSFQTTRPIQILLGVFGSMAFEGPLIDWVGRHRLHHQYSDRDGDPHSPYPHADGVRGWLGGFWHSHIGWAFTPMQRGLDKYAPDLLKDPAIRVVSALFPLWSLVGLLIPAAVGLAAGGWYGALTGFLWGGLVRMLLVHHVTWCVNSVCHLWGTRPYPEKDESRNNPVIGLLALGEGWHNNHHAFPTSARHGLKWWQVDLSWYVIRSLAAVGLAWDVKLPAPEKLR